MASMKDPVCGMLVDSSSAAGRVSFGGQTYFFCSTDCLRKFEADPRGYVSETVAAAEATPGSTEELERHEPPYTRSGGIVAPKFGSAGSGGLEYERLPEKHDEEPDHA